MGIRKTLASIVLAGAMTLGLTGKANAGLIGEWNFNEGSGNVAYDSSGQERDGTINGASYVDGRNETGLNFNGNSYVDIQSTSALNLQPEFSLSAWVKFNEYNDDTVIVGKHISGNVSGFFLGVQNNKFDFYVENLPFSGEDRLRSSQTYNDGQWHHVVGEYDGTTQFLYVDDVLQAQQEHSHLINNSADWKIGGIFEGQNNGGFIGNIDEVRIYDSVVPEPSTLALFGLGALGLAKMKRRAKDDTR